MSNTKKKLDRTGFGRLAMGLFSPERISILTKALTNVLFIIYYHKMSTHKRELLNKLIEEGLWKRLSWCDIRLYLFLVICADERKGEGRLSLEVLEKCLGDKFSWEQLEKAAHNLEKLHLAKINISSSASEIEFEFLGGE